MNYLLREKPLELSSSKVPEITFAFWVMKVAATTLGETGGGTVSMTMHLVYALSSAIFLAFFLVTATVQLSSRTFHPFLYWSGITSSLVVAIFILGCILFTSQRAGHHGGESGSAKSN